jgi:polyhydroxybutyrate depolymerase
VPAGARPRGDALIVVVVPGGDGDGSDRLGVTPAAHPRRLLPSSTPPPTTTFWALNRAQGTADVDDVSGAAGRVLAGVCFDAGGSHHGVSNGAGFAAAHGLRAARSLRRRGPVARGYRALDPCPADARASFLDDPRQRRHRRPLQRQARRRAGSVPRYTARWARRDGCERAAREPPPRPRVTRFALPRLRRRPARRAAAPVGDRPRLAGRGPPLPDHNPSGVSATRELLRFVAGAGAVKARDRRGRALAASVA